MMSWTLTFLVITLISGVLGFSNLVGAAAGIFQILFVIYFFLTIIAFLVEKKD